MPAAVHLDVPRVVAPPSRWQTMAAVAVTVAVLYLGREILMPLALAALLSFALVRPVAGMERLGFGRTWSVGLVAGAVVIVLGLTSWLAWTQLSAVVADIPSHRTAIKQKIGELTRRVAAVEAAGQSLVPEQDAPAGGGLVVRTPQNVVAGSSPVHPVFVTPIDSGPTLLGQLSSAVGWLLHPFAVLGMTILFAIFMLLYREDLRNRFIRLCSNGDLTGTTLAMTEASRRIGRYLGMQMLINTASGAIAALGLFLLGVPGWALWGFLYALLRFLPYVGPVTAVAFPVATALAVSPGWGLFAGTLAFLLTLELIVNLVLEPWLYGESTGVSSFAVLVSAAVWTWLWGPIGLFLAMPLTVFVVVLGKSVRRFGFLNVLFGTDDVLTPTDRYYQRAIANDPDEATRILAEVSSDRSLPDVYETVLVPGLIAAERDRAGGKLSEEAYATVCENIHDSLEEMELLHAKVGEAAAATVVAASESGDLEHHGRLGNVLCLPMKGRAHEVAAAVLCRLLDKAGFASSLFAAEASPGEPFDPLGGAETVCVVTLPDATLRQVRLLCRQLKERHPYLRIVVLAWGASVDPTVWRLRSLTAHTDAFATNAADAVIAIRRLQERVVAAPA